MALELWIENGENKPAVIVQDSAETAPTGYTKSTDASPFGASHIEDWHRHGGKVIGSVAEFMDWKCLRDIIRDAVEAKGGVDYSTYVANLSAGEKAVAAIYVPTKISDALGFAQLITDSGGAAQAFDNIDHYLAEASKSRSKRYKEVVGYVYKWMGKNQALQAEDDVLVNNLKDKYISRGVLLKSEDSVDGFEDWVQGVDGFVANGLKAKLESSVWTLISGAPSNTDFCQKITDCARGGKYPIS